MVEMTEILEYAVQFLDKTPLPGDRAGAIIRQLFSNLEITDEAERAILNPVGKGNSEIAQAQSLLWARIEAAAGGTSARERLILSAASIEAPLDGYLLEYLIHWAGLIGIPKGEIEGAVLECLPEFRRQISH
jgi:hypothetical protein